MDTKLSLKKPVLEITEEDTSLQIYVKSTN